MNFKGKTILGIMAALFMAGQAQAANIPVNANIAASTTWTANNVYNLVGQIYVLPGATLTIEAGTQIRSIPADGGSLAVTRGARIFVNGTEADPVVFTSTSDTGISRLGVNEWGNLTLMGNGVISASHFGGNPVARPAFAGGGFNTKDPSGLNIKQMEGLTACCAGNDPNVFFGGNNDNDNSGAIHYISLRFGGKVLGLGNELNALSLGGIGRETDIDHVDIFNNVDDGIEIWGGTVNLKYVNIWNIGDDSLDIDEGWRGKAQFGLIVQGHAAVAAQGSGVGDNAMEFDGAEDSDAQPVTTATVYNFTVVGQPGGGVPANGGDHGTAWRDNARVQVRNSIFMDLGEKVIFFENQDGDGGQGYGFNGTLSWLNTWTTNAGVDSTVNPCIGCLPGQFNHADTLYTVQTTGKLAELSDSVFYNNPNGTAYSESDIVGATVGGNDAPLVNNIVAASSPIVSITRSAPVAVGTRTMEPVTLIDPRPANDALVSAASAPLDGFFTPAPYRGGFSDDNNWLCGWTAAHEFGLTTACANPADPSETIQLTTTTFFQTVAGVNYVVEASTDGSLWSPVATIAGDGTIKNITDLAVFSNAKLYRAIAL